MTGGRGRGRFEALRAFGLGDEDVAAWQDSRLSDDAFDDWLTDRLARRPAGSRARAVYGAADVHDFARRAILGPLGLTSSDHVLDVGCGGGLLLRDVLAAGAHACGIDHSADMVELARERAPGAKVEQADAGKLPFGDDTFTAVAMSVVFFFLDQPLVALRECRRVMRPGGRLAVYTAGPELRGSPAAPEPIASRGHFYADDELADLARAAGLRNPAVRRDDGAQLLFARK